MRALFQKTVRNVKDIFIVGIISVIIIAIVLKLFKFLWLLLLSLPHDVIRVIHHFSLSSYADHLVVLLALVVILGILFTLWQPGKLITRLPIVGTIIKFIVTARKLITSHKKKKKPWSLIESSPDIYHMGFTLGLSDPEIDAKTGGEKIKFFLITSPNPISGFTLYLPKEKITSLDWSFERGIQEIISAGQQSEDQIKEIKEIFSNIDIQEKKNDAN